MHATPERALRRYGSDDASPGRTHVVLVGARRLELRLHHALRERSAVTLRRTARRRSRLVNQTWAADETRELSIRFDETRIAMTMKCDRLVETAEGIEPSVAIEPPWGGSAAAQCSCVTHLGAIYSRSSGE